MAKPEHVHAWQDSARLQKTCNGCETVASRERDGSGAWVTTYRPTLRAETAQRLRAAGITADDAGLQQANASQRRTRGAPGGGNSTTAEGSRQGGRGSMSTSGQDPARAGSETARQIISAQAEAGRSADQVRAHHEDIAASLLSGAVTDDERAFAREYDETAGALIADLREMERPEPDRTPGTPHPDARLAAQGWHNCEHGIYVRRQPEAEADHEAA